MRRVAAPHCNIYVEHVLNLVAVIHSSHSLSLFQKQCQTCQSIAMDFKHVAVDWKGHEIGLVAQVDCEGIGSQKICDDFEIAALPTILYGDITNLEVYDGDLTYTAMSAFAKEHISHPSCSMKHMDYCSEENRQRLVELQNQ
jgi:thioredoxin-like negative regulator of GroEL